MTSRFDLAAVLVVTVLALVGVVVLAALQLVIPDVLPYVATAGAGALGMAARATLAPARGAK